MKIITSTLTLLCLTAGLATAGDYYSGKQPLPPQPPVAPDCDCFAPGVELSLFGSGIVTDQNDELGGGAGLGFFFTENFGINTSYHVFATDPSEQHFATVDLVFRMPIQELCIAPYVFGGGGVVTNGETDGLWRLGGGIDIRLEAMGCVGIFVDASYNWIGNSDSEHDDATLIRAGFKIPF